MQVAYFDCFSGISGDMIIGAMLDAGLELSYLESEIKKLGLKNVEIKASKTVRQNIASTQFTVLFEEQKHHRHLKDLYALVDNTSIDQDIKDKAKEVFHKIAVAEAKIHNMPVEKVHFHEIGAIDTIVDVLGALTGFRKLGIEKVFSSKLNVGSGFVTFSHGKFPVPAPATAEILKNIPVYATDSGGELVTPTGAAIITSICDSFGNMPSMRTRSIGYGSGTKEFEHPNVLRLYLGEITPDNDDGSIYILETNIDDMNPQFYDHVFEKLYSEGALEVFMTNIQMKKNRPGIKLTILSPVENKERLLRVIFRETTSIGVRSRREARDILKREVRILDTPFGQVKAKVSYYKGEPVNTKVEYDDLKKLAAEHGEPLKNISSEITRLLE
jgi:pyridinium-3,5-bisthiocarboxylic acid mononucleotide nickel chelatase